MSVRRLALKFGENGEETKQIGRKLGMVEFFLIRILNGEEEVYLVAGVVERVTLSTCV